MCDMYNVKRYRRARLRTGSAHEPATPHGSGSRDCLVALRGVARAERIKYSHCSSRGQDLRPWPGPPSLQPRTRAFGLKLRRINTNSFDVSDMAMSPLSAWPPLCAVTVIVTHDRRWLLSATFQASQPALTQGRGRSSGASDGESEP